MVKPLWTNWSKWDKSTLREVVAIKNVLGRFPDQQIVRSRTLFPPYVVTLDPCDRVEVRLRGSEHRFHGSVPSEVYQLMLLGQRLGVTQRR